MKHKDIVFSDITYRLMENGELFNLTRNMRKVKGQLNKRNKGYIYYNIGGKNKTAHRLVCEHFNGDIPKGEQVMHRNGDRFDNRADNLICGSNQENVETYQKHLAQGSHDALTILHHKIRQQYKSGLFSKEVLSLGYGYPTDVIIAISRSEF